jgi:hypothetical protein
METRDSHSQKSTTRFLMAGGGRNTGACRSKPGGIRDRTLGILIRAKALCELPQIEIAVNHLF